MKTIPSEIQPILSSFKKTVQEMYGDRLEKILLYGSYARGDYNTESDIDLMVVLKDENISVAEELYNYSHLGSKILLDFGKLISVLPVSMFRFYNERLSVYSEAQKEGVEI
jgi:predicted nucleotidyltransferase